MKKARMNISHFGFILFNLKIFGKIVTTFILISLIFATSIKENQFFSLPHEANSLISKKRLVSITIFQIYIYCVQRASEIASNRSIALDF